MQKSFLYVMVGVNYLESKNAGLFALILHIKAVNLLNAAETILFLFL